MKTKAWVSIIGLAISLHSVASAGTFGTVVPLGGLASDLALDEGRGVLYVANFTANRVDVISLADNSFQRSINVASQPSSLSVSPDGKYLVIAHYGNYANPAPSDNALTVINLNTNQRQTFALGSAPFGVAFGSDGKALVATATEFDIFDPATGTSQLLTTVSGIISNTLPQAPATFPPNITAASLGVSRNGNRIFGLTDTIKFGYDVPTGHLDGYSYTSEPPMGPRVVSVNQDGTKYLSGWGLFDGNFTLAGTNDLTSQFPDPKGDLSVGSHAIDTARGLAYAQIPSTATGAPTTPILQVVDSENLAVLERLNLPENLAGKSVLTSDGNTMYAISESGITVLPVGQMSQVRRITATQPDVVFRSSACTGTSTSQDITIVDKSGAGTDFSISSSNPAVVVNPTSGITPAKVRVTINPSALAGSKGTTAVTLTLASQNAANIPQTVRVLVNNKEPDQRGTFVDVPGKLVDLLADPDRDRFYIIRQDTNQILVFDSNTNTQVATLKTGNTPTQLAISFDHTTLLAGSDNSQQIYMWNLDTLQPLTPIHMPGGHYPKSIAAAGDTVLVANRVAGPVHVIDQVDLNSGIAQQLPSLGVFKNDINIDTYLVASPNGASVLAAEADGNVLLYDSTQQTFTVSRKVVASSGGTGTGSSASLTGPYAASNYNQYVVGNLLLNSSLVPMATLGTSTAGFAFIDQTSLRATAANAADAGTLERFSASNLGTRKSALMVEAPVLSDLTVPFTRTLAPLANQKGIVALTTSGFTVLPWNYDANLAAPTITSVVNGADFTPALAPNSLVTIMGTNLSSVTQSFTGGSGSLPDSCLMVNGQAIPVLYVSSTQINGQLPPVDSGTLRLVTPGGAIDNVQLNLQPAAPAIFKVTLPGLAQPVPAIIRAKNNLVVTPSNPIHRGDVLVIYATGLGHTSPEVQPGVPAPTDTLSGVTIAPHVTIGGVEAQVLFAGLTPGQIGVYQINVKVYNDVPLGMSEPLVITQGTGSASATVRVVQ